MEAAGNFTIEMTDSPSEEDLAGISGPLRAFNEERTGLATGYRPLAIFLREPGTARVVGGLWGMTYFEWLYVDLLFIPETMRGNGLGRRLLCQAEEEGRRRGCVGVWLDTFSWQARGFYEGLGYTVFGEIGDFPRGHRRFFLRRYFGEGGTAGDPEPGTSTEHS